MTETKSEGTLKEVGEGLKSILERIGDFFDIFDLSFLVSGATTAAALSFLGWRADIHLPPIPEGWISVVGLIIACYVLGLVCFAVGRWSRMGWRSRKAEQAFYKMFVVILDGHGLTKVPTFTEYLERKQSRGDWRLYVRLWAELRHSPGLIPSFSILRRYWVMAATYDGVAVSLFVWAAVSLLCTFDVAGVKPIPKLLTLPGSVALIISAIACSREAGRYVNYQVEELVASIAAKRAADGR